MKSQIQTQILSVSHFILKLIKVVLLFIRILASRDSSIHPPDDCSNHSQSNLSLSAGIEQTESNVRPLHDSDTMCIKYNRLLKRNDHLKRELVKLQKENDILKKQTMGSSLFSR